MTICVFCSARNQVSDIYKQWAADLGTWIAQHHHTLLFGGATGGLMSSVSEAASAGGAEIVGVIPHSIMRKGRESTLVTQQVRVSSMSERKAEMRRLSDVFVVLPGGLGTLDEMFDIIGSGTVGEHHKPMIVFSPDGFYRPLMQQIDQMCATQFIPAEQSYQFTLAETYDQLIAQLERIAV